jgi:(p)ppGpp synthase/HD superfamily hydrolase
LNDARHADNPDDELRKLMGAMYPARAAVEAVQYATTLHAGQRRKGTDTPYLAHPFVVAAIVLAHVGAEVQAISALLHDTIEDHPCGGRTRVEIRERFGEEVLAIVEACTDADAHSKPPWRERKERYLAHLPQLSREERLVALADKVHNARAILADFRTIGDQVWHRFNPAKSDVLWYYRALADAFSEVDATRSQEN